MAGPNDRFSRTTSVTSPTHPAAHLMPPRVSEVAFILALFLLFARPAETFAIDAPAARPQEDATLAQQIAAVPTLESLENDLRSQQFDRRQQAMLYLWSHRDQYRQWVEGATRDADPEVARRAHWILDRWRRGLLPDTPQEVANRLEGASGPDTIENLMNAGLFDGALVAVDEAIGGANSPAILDRAAAAVRRRFPFYVRAAAENNQLPSLLKILSRLSYEAPIAIAFDELSQKLPSSSDAADELEQNAVPVPAAVGRPQNLFGKAGQSNVRVIQLAAAGKLDEAIALATQEKDADALRVCRMLSGKWQAMATDEALAAQQATKQSPQWYRHWIYVLMATSRAERSEELDALRVQAIENLVMPRTEEADQDRSDSLNRIRWQSLAMHGELDAAVTILKRISANDAAELLGQAGRFAEAFDMLGVNVQDLSAGVQELADEAIKAERSETAINNDQGTRELARLLAAVRLLVAIGQDSLAFQTLRSVVDDATLGGQDAVSMARIEAIRTASRLNRNDWIGPLLIGPTDTTLSGRAHFFLAMIFDSEVETVTALLDAAARIRPQADYPSRVRLVVDLLSGETPAEFDNQKDMDDIYDTLSTSMRAVVGQGGRMMLASTARLSLDLARLFELHNRPDLARRAIKTLADAGAADAILQQSLSELNEGSAAVARSDFEMVWQKVETQGRDLARLNQADADAFLALKAIYGEATAARRLGDVEGAESLTRLLELMCCTPSAALRSSFAEFLLEQGNKDDAARLYRPLLRWVAFGSDEGVEFYTIARNFDSAVSETNPGEAAMALDLAVSGTIETTVFYPAAYVSLPAYVHRRWINDAIEKNDQRRTRDEIDKLLKLAPTDIDFGEKTLESMREKAMSELADETLDKIYQSGQRHMSQFPQNISMANNLAWIMALSNYRLDDALALSSRAVHREPESTVYRDTLAEVLYRLGRVDEAIAIEKACLLDDPAEWHVHEQIRRFEAGEP